MEFWLDFLPIVIFILLIILLIVGIIIGVKTIITMNKVDKIVNSVYEKVESMNSMFNVIDHISDTIAGVTDRMVGAIGSVFSKLVFRKNKRKEEE